MNPSAAIPDGGDAYHVLLGGGQLRVLSLDELDAAFNAGSIDERTFVLAPGSTEWTRLGDLAGLDEDPPPAPAPVMAPVRAFVPVAVAAPAPSVIPPSTV